MKKFIALTLIALHQLAQASGESEPIKPKQDYPCDSHGKKVCPVPEKCESGVWNEDACECFSQIQCALWCGEGKGLDPRYGCKCVE